MSFLGALLAFIPFINPVPFPAGARLVMFLPLSLCVAVVYRATRARRVDEMLKPTLTTFASIVIGMVAIAIGLYVVSEAAIRYF